jgi:hypothetical protein
MPLYRLICFSRRTADAASPPPVTEILRHEHDLNAASGLTGALVFDARWFVHILEGSRSRVSGSFIRIARNPFETGVEIVAAGHIDERRFPAFALAGLDVAAQPAGIIRRFTNGLAFDPSLMTAEGLMRFAEAAIAAGEIVFLDDAR